MFEFAQNIKELVAKNISAALDAANDPTKALRKLQCDLEDELVALEGERSLAYQRKKRLEAERTQTELREADWADKAKSAMDKGREDLAKQALLAREECRARLTAIAAEIDAAESAIAQAEKASAELEFKRAKTIAALKEHQSTAAVDAKAAEVSKAHSKVDAMDKRAGFAMDQTASPKTMAEAERERSIEEELDALRRRSDKV